MTGHRLFGVLGSRRVAFFRTGMETKLRWLGKYLLSLGSSARHWKGHTHEMKSASMDPAPKNFVYAETYPR